MARIVFYGVLIFIRHVFRFAVLKPRIAWIALTIVNEGISKLGSGRPVCLDILRPTRPDSVTYEYSSNSVASPCPSLPPLQNVASVPQHKHSIWSLAFSGSLVFASSDEVSLDKTIGIWPSL